MKILRIGEETDHTIIYTAGEINLGMQMYGDMVVDILPKASGRLYHKSFYYASINIKVTPLLK